MVNVTDIFVFLSPKKAKSTKNHRVGFGQKNVKGILADRLVAYNRMNQGTQNYIEIQITDQNGNPVYFNDPQITILLTVNDGDY